jgi:hypothetical protein
VHQKGSERQLDRMIIIIIVERYFSSAKFDIVIPINCIVVATDGTVVPTETLLHTSANFWFCSY